MKIAPDVLKKYGQKAIDEEIARQTKAVEAENKILLKEEYGMMDRRYIICSVGSKIRIVDTMNPMGCQWSVDDAKDYLDRKSVV